MNIATATRTLSAGVSRQAICDFREFRVVIFRISFLVQLRLVSFFFFVVVSVAFLVA